MGQLRIPATAGLHGPVIIYLSTVKEVDLNCYELLELLSEYQNTTI